MSLCQRLSHTLSPGVIDTASLPRSRLNRIRCFSNFTRLGTTTGDDATQATSKVIADLSKAYRSKVRNRTVTARISRSTVSLRSSVRKESIVRKVHFGQYPAGETTPSLQASTDEHGVDRGSLLPSEGEEQSGTLQIRKYLYELPFDKWANPMEIPLRARYSPETEEMKTCDPVESHDNSEELAIGNRWSSKAFLQMGGTCRGESPPIRPVVGNRSMICQFPPTGLEKMYPNTRKHTSCGQERAKPDVLGRTVHAASVVTRDLGDSNGRDMINPGHETANDQQARREAVGRVHIDRSMVTRSYCDPDEADLNPTNRNFTANDNAELDVLAEKVDAASFLTIRNVDHSARKVTEPMIRKYKFNDQKQATQDTLLDDMEKASGDLLYTYNQLQLRKPRNQAKDNAVQWDSRKKYPHWQRVANNAEAIEEFGNATGLISQSIDRLSEDLKDLDVARETKFEFDEHRYNVKSIGRWPRAHDGSRRKYAGSEAPRIIFVYDLPATAVTTA